MNGINNLGNTCYMNSVLQLLMNCNSFLNEISKTNNYKINEFTNFINEYKTSNNSVKPRELKKLIEKNLNFFNNYNQHDSFEFLLFF